MVKIIGNVLAIRWTAGAVEHLRPSFSALLDAEERLASVIRRWAGQPHQLKPSNHTVLDTVGALEPIAQPPPPRRRISGPCGRVRGAYVGPLRPGLASLGTSCSTILGL